MSFINRTNKSAQIQLTGIQRYQNKQFNNNNKQFNNNFNLNNNNYNNNNFNNINNFNNKQFNNNYNNNNFSNNNKQFIKNTYQQPAIIETQPNNLLNKVKEIKTEEKPIITGKYQHLTSNEMNDICYETFQEIYKNRVKKTKVESIINGEIITTNKDNIFVNTTTYEDPKFDEKCKLCTKKLYKYQIDAIKMLRQLELTEIFEHNGEKIHSNGYLLHLPIGSGKSLVFTFLSLMYHDIPPKPIIISTSGIHIPEDRMTQLKFYPFYYENVGYIVGKENCAVCVKDYVQRKMTVIVTHFHLIDQLIDYIHSDFVSGVYHPKINKIFIATDPRQIDLNCNILIVPAKPEMIDRLSVLSCDQPFARVIVDDYTNMPGIEQYRQIRATSTIFVSGSGFERDIEKIPPSYYTLRHIEVDKFSLVADPKETSEGILRSNVITFNLIGAQNEFSMYKFVNEIDDHCINKYSLVASNVYEPIVKNGNKLFDYLNLNFILKNYDKFNKSINMIMQDVDTGKLNKERVSFFYKFKDIINQKSKILIMRNKKQVTEEIDNPIYSLLFKPINQVPQGIQPMLMMTCQVCGALPQQHKGWGFISCCCGSFFCSECGKNMVTRDLILIKGNEEKKIHDDNHYYCVVCHKNDPVYVSNSTRHKDINNIQTHHIVDQYMDISDLKNHLHVDYYFKMFTEGFKPKYFDGKTIECEVNSDEKIEQLIPKDQLALNCIERINECLKKLEIKPSLMNTIKPQLLIYGCPDYMQKRVEQYFKAFSSDSNEALYSLNILFKNSLSELIGLHQNILGILVWNNPKHIDEIQQLIGRIVRLNNWNNPVYFYITCTGGVNVKEENVNITPEKPKLGMTIIGNGMNTIGNGMNTMGNGMSEIGEGIGIGNEIKKEGLDFGF